MRFPVVLHTDDGIRYGVTVPDLPGCFSAGDTLDEALDSVREAIDLHIEGLIAEGCAIPHPRPLAEHRANLDFADGVLAVVSHAPTALHPQFVVDQQGMPQSVLLPLTEYRSLISALSDFQS